MSYIGPAPNPGQNREVDDISGSFNGSEVNFTLQVNSQNVSPGSSNAIIVSVGGVIQNPGTDYTVAASTLTFTTAPASGLSFFGLVLGQQVDTEGTADNSITTVKIADQAVTLAKLPHGTGSTDGKFLRANNGADPTFETITGTTINNQADNRLITCTGTTNTLNGESTLTFGSDLLNISSTTQGLGLRLTNTANEYTNIQFSAARTGADQALGIINAKWNNNHEVAAIYLTAGDDTSNKDDGKIKFYTSASGGSLSEAMQIDEAGRVGIGTNNPEYLLNVVKGGIDMCRFQQTTNNTSNGYEAILIKHAAALSGQNGLGIRFQNSGGTTVGRIDIGQSTTGYVTSSDYRLKENAVTISDGITRLKTLKPYRFNWKEEKGQPKVDGFFAHEVTAVPEAVRGTKDEVDADNKPLYQGLDHSKLVPLLTAALQEAISKIEVLETKVAALEAA